MCNKEKRTDMGRVSAEALWTLASCGGQGGLKEVRLRAGSEVEEDQRRGGPGDQRIPQREKSQLSPMAM